MVDLGADPAFFFRPANEAVRGLRQPIHPAAAPRLGISAVWFQSSQGAGDRLSHRRPALDLVMAHKADFEEPKAETHPTRGITDAETVTAGLSPANQLIPGCNSAIAPDTARCLST